MNENKKMFLRYSFLIITGFLIGYLYDIFRPLTLYPVYYGFKILGYNPLILNGNIHIGYQELVFVNACIAASAYYLFLVLVLSTKGLTFEEILKIYGIGVISILFVNILRIIGMGIILIRFEENLFETWHMILWRFVATFFIAFLWIYLSRKFLINNIPFYTDFEYLLNKSFLKKKH